MGERVGIDDPARLAAVRASGLLDTPPDEAFDRLARLAALVLETPYAFVTLVDDVRSYWKAAIGIESNDPADRQNTVAQSFCQYVVASGDRLIVDDAANNPVTRDNPSIEAMGVAAWAGFPLRAPGGEVLGSFCVVDTGVRSWTDREVAVLETLAAAAGNEVTLRMTAVAEATASAQARADQRRLRFLAEVSEMLQSAPDAEAAVGALAEEVVPYLADWALVCLVDDSTGERRDIGRAHRDPALMPAVNRYADLHRPASTSPIPTVIRTGEPMAIPAIDTALLRSSLSPDAIDAVADLAPTAAAVMPLAGRGKPFGAVALYNGIERGAHTADELLVAHEMARRAGLIMENARLQEHERGIAEIVQRSVLDRPPEVAGVELAVRYRPAAEGTRVGGDWYDAFHRRDGSLLLVIGDIVGHDMTAVAAMSQVRTMMRSIAYDREESPAQVLRRVDVAMRGLAVVGLCTALVVHLDPRDIGPHGMRFTWSSAGHPPLLITAPGGDLVVEAEPEVLLGVLPATLRADHEGLLPHDATMLLMTDGLFERRDRDLDDSLLILREQLRGLAGRPLEVLCDQLIAGAGAGTNEDDAAFLAIRISAVTG